MKKKCSRCGEVKDASLFQVRRASNDGLTAACKSCLSEYDKTRANLKHRVDARAAYQKTDAGVTAVYRAKKKYAESHRTDAAKRLIEYRKNNPAKARAHDLVSYAKKIGHLSPEPCQICGSTKNIHAHHDDYAKPLNVRWLCASHHKQWHRDNGEALNP